MQRRRHRPDDEIADEACQHEDRQDADEFHRYDPCARFGCTTAPAARQRDALGDVVVFGEDEHLGFLVPEGRDEVVEVAGVERGGVGGEAARHVAVADDLDAVDRRNLAGYRAFDVAALLDCEVDDYRALPHRGDLRVADQARRRATGDQCGGDDDVLLGDVRGDELGLRRLVFVGHFGGVAAGALALDAFDVLDEDRLGAEALDLLLGGGADVGRRDHRAQPPGGGDRLETGDADAHDEDARRADRAGSSHHHREGAAVFGGGVEHRLVAREVRLRRQHVHRLRAGDARHQLHRQRVEPGARIAVDPRAVSVGIEDRGD